MKLSNPGGALHYLKIWRAMWKVSAALGHCVLDADPSLGVRISAGAIGNLD
jgi:hypothetical protein